MRTAFKVLLIGVALLGGVGGLIWQGQRASKLRHAIASLRVEKAAVATDNVRLKQIVADRDESGATLRVQEEIEKTRAEIAVWESRWRQVSTHTPKRTTYEHFTANRDPMKGPVRVEHFRNAGQATPTAAFQSLVWALATDAGDALVPLLGISPTGREKLEVMVARMSSEQQARYRPPEKVVGMLLALDLLDEEGFEIVGELDVSRQMALLVRRARNGRKSLIEKRLPFQRGPAGWQLTITDKMIEDLPVEIEQASMYVPPRRSEN